VSARSARRERTHAAILDEACRLLRERGIGGARVADVMRGAGLTVGGFYAHFASKEALVDDALRRTAAASRARFFAGIEHKPPAARLAVLMKRYLSSAHRDHPGEGCPLPAVAGEVSLTAPEHRQVLASEIDAMAAAIAEHLPKGGPAAPGAQAGRGLALGVVALLYGGLSLARATRGTPLSDEILRACRALGAAATGAAAD
jgi:TetR/AcrR family transcriptional repressor of nem operon